MEISWHVGNEVRSLADSEWRLLAIFEFVSRAKPVSMSIILRVLRTKCIDDGDIEPRQIEDTCIKVRRNPTILGGMIRVCDECPVWRSNGQSRAG